ncbi:indoleacetamide hydrolase [Desmonostoc muscorum CCALA 125]|nr:indoleacetamide hydrolase [Desmonostoc muscorum CCALA 125]
MTDLTSLTITGAAADIRDRHLTSVALTEALLRNVDAGRHLNALIYWDSAHALAAAQNADQAINQGQSLGPLHGVPLVLKDNIHVARIPNTAGTPALRHFIPTEDAPVAKTLRDAGAIILGKANMHELGWGITSNNATFGPVKNAYDQSRFAGGSSGGTGAAIAARMAAGGLGTDTGGSVRIPAALNGIMGFRPTVKRYAQEGITPISSTRDTAGPMARSVADLALLDSVITEDFSPLEPRVLKGLRLGVDRGYFYRDIDTETLKITEAALTKLRLAGIEIIELNIPHLAELYAKIALPIALYEGKRDLLTYLATYQVGVTLNELASQIASPDVKALFAATIVGPQAISEAVYREALTIFRPQLQQAYAEAFEQCRIDALIFPTTPLPAQPILGSDENVMLNGHLAPTFSTFIQNTDPGSLVGIPGLTLPIGQTAQGLPIGIELDGPIQSDRRLLSIGLALELEEIFSSLAVTAS